MIDIEMVTQEHSERRYPICCKHPLPMSLSIPAVRSILLITGQDAVIIDQLWHSDIIMGKTALDPRVTWHLDGESKTSGEPYQ